MPGRKTAGKDAEWLAQLLRHGLVRASVMPNRELRELTRYRTALIHARANEVNRLQKTLAGTTITLAAVLTDVTGVSGQKILDALGNGEDDPAVLADLAHGREQQQQREALARSLVGQLPPMLRFVLRHQVRHIHEVDDLIAACDAEVEQRMLPVADELARLDEIPGVRTALVIVAERGVDMTRFPTAQHAAAWAGSGPGNNASGGKRR